MNRSEPILMKPVEHSIITTAFHLMRSIFKPSTPKQIQRRLRVMLYDSTSERFRCVELPEKETSDPSSPKNATIKRDVYKEYDTPTGKVTYTREEFFNVVKAFEILRSWNRKKTP